MKQRMKALKDAADAARQTNAYHAEGASIGFTEEIVSKMESSGITRSGLAEKIGSSPAYITKILRGDTNFTLDTMTKIATALGYELTIGLRPTPKSKHRPVNYREIGPVKSPVLNDGTE